MKSMTVLFLALTAVVGLVVADFGYGGYGSYGSGGAGYTYMPAYGYGGAGSGLGNNQCM